MLRELPKQLCLHLKFRHTVPIAGLQLQKEIAGKRSEETDECIRDTNVPSALGYLRHSGSGWPAETRPT